MERSARFDSKCNFIQHRPYTNECHGRCEIQTWETLMAVELTRVRLSSSWLGSREYTRILWNDGASQRYGYTGENLGSWVVTPTPNQSFNDYDTGLGLTEDMRNNAGHIRLSYIQSSGTSIRAYCNNLAAGNVKWGWTTYPNNRAAERFVNTAPDSAGYATKLFVDMYFRCSDVNTNGYNWLVLAYAYARV